MQGQDGELLQRIHGRLKKLYPDRHRRCAERLTTLLGRYGLGSSDKNEPYRWDQRDTILITYGNSLHSPHPEETPLSVLHGFLTERLQDAFNTVHILPFFPYSSDDGFAVTDYRRVNPELGSWDDIQNIADDYRLMVDLVLNHVSRESEWFRNYERGRAPESGYFIEVDPEADLSKVVRPRSTPLLAPVQTRHGKRYVWSTFSEDQIDLNFSNPDVLFEFVDLLLYYIMQGARLIRMDAIAYLWKKIGTSCIHLPETHEMVKLFRDIVELVAPDVLLVTETNVPHEENISYFGEGDEAHMAYQFPLPPLLVHALRRGTSAYLREWAAGLGDIPDGCTFLNFTASHDGIGLRPAEGLLPAEEIDAMVEGTRRRGGMVKTRRTEEGEDKPYEMNITYYDALRDPEDGELDMDRYMCSQAVMLELQGVPGVYIHNLFATPNDRAAAEQTGETRAINRSTFDIYELEQQLDDPDSRAARAFDRYSHLLKVRKEQPAFHPDGSQVILNPGENAFALLRTSPDRQQRILALNNFTARLIEVEVDRCLPSAPEGPWTNLLDGREYGGGTDRVQMEPYQSLWLEL